MPQRLLLTEVIEIIDAPKVSDQWTNAQSAGPNDALIAATDKTHAEKPALIAHLAPNVRLEQTASPALTGHRVPIGHLVQTAHRGLIAAPIGVMTAGLNVARPVAMRTVRTDALIVGRPTAKKTAKSVVTARDAAIIKAIVRPIAIHATQTVGTATITATRTVVM